MDAKRPLEIFPAIAKQVPLALQPSRLFLGEGKGQVTTRFAAVATGAAAAAVG